MNEIGTPHVPICSVPKDRAWYRDRTGLNKASK